jgi:outer membrane protein OmpA-like peptidoglycan-associated protein
MRKSNGARVRLWTAIALSLVAAEHPAIAKRPAVAPPITADRGNLERLFECLRVINIPNFAKAKCTFAARITFDGGWKLKPTQMDMLRELGPLLNQPGVRQARVRLIGHASCGEPGARDDEQALRLSFRRAEVVREALSDAGDVRASRLVAEGRGYFEPAERPNELRTPDRRCDPVTAGDTSLDRRVELAIDSPVAAHYGGTVGNFTLAPLVGTDKAGPVIRYMPRGLHPSGWFTVDLSSVSNAFRPNSAAAASAGCRGATTGWATLDQPLSNLDDGTGDFRIRLRSVPRRVKGRVEAAILLDLQGVATGGTPPAPPAPPALPGFWSLRERLPVALRQILTGTSHRGGSTPAPAYVLPVGATWGGPGHPGSLLAIGCGLSQARADETYLSRLKPAVDAVLEAVPLTALDVLAREIDLHPSLLFHRVDPGMRLCVRSTNMSYRGNSQRFSFTNSVCEVVREFRRDDGGRSLAFAPEQLWTERSGLGTTHHTHSDPGPPQIVRSARWSHLLSVDSSDGAYVFLAGDSLPERAAEDWSGDLRFSSGLLGVQQAANAPMLLAMLRNNFVVPGSGGITAWHLACGVRGSSGWDIAQMPLPGAFWNLSNEQIESMRAHFADQRAMVQTYVRTTNDKGLVTVSIDAAAARHASSRCATVERAAEVAPEFGISVGGTQTFVPVSTTFGQLASESRISEARASAAAARSRAAARIFGDRPGVTWSSAAAERLPVLEGETIAW